MAERIVACPGCNARLKIPAASTSRAIKCPKCQTVISLASRAPAPAPVELEASMEMPVARGRSGTRRSKKPQSIPPVVWVSSAGGLAAVVVGVVVIALVFRGGKSNRTEAANASGPAPSQPAAATGSASPSGSVVPHVPLAGPTFAWDRFVSQEFGFAADFPEKALPIPAQHLPAGATGTEVIGRDKESAMYGVLAIKFPASVITPTPEGAHQLLTQQIKALGGRELKPVTRHTLPGYAGVAGVMAELSLEGILPQILMVRAYLVENRLYVLTVSRSPAAATPAGSEHFFTSFTIGTPQQPLPEIAEEEYVAARAKFHTKLLRTGPSPQPWKPVTAPAGVNEVEFTSGDLRLKAWMSAPPSGDALQPAVLYLHGGFAFDVEDWQVTQPFRDAGFIVMAPILRGENGLPGSFTLFYDEVDDVVAAAELLAASPKVDTKRIFVAGHSAGGTLTLLAAMMSNRFRAAASFSATPEQEMMVRAGPALFPFDSRDKQELRMRSPLAFAASLKCPVRLYYGQFEPHLSESSHRLTMEAKKRNINAEVDVVPGDHMTSLNPSIAKSIEFFQTQQ